MITEWIKEITIWFGDLGYWGVFLASFGLFPKELVIAIAGAIGEMNLFLISAVAGLGAMIGAIPIYLIGHHFRNTDILKFINGKGKVLHISEDSYNSGQKYVKKGGVVFVYFSRFLPWIRVATVLVTGYLKYNIVLVLIAIFLGTSTYAYVFGRIGSKIGFNWEQIKNLLDAFNNVVLVGIGLGIIIFVYINRKKFFGKKNTN